MRRIIKPNQTSISETPVAPPVLSDVSIARLIDDGLLTLHREMKNILIMSAKGKLDAASARDLRDHLKLLFELKDREDASLNGLTDDELKEQVKDLLFTEENNE